MPPTAARRYLHSVPVNSGANEPLFAVRFPPAGGLAALLRRPANGFGWVGAGTVRFDEQGLEACGSHRWLLGLRTRQRFHPGDVRDVYREGDAVELELRDGRRLRFRAEGATAASAIVGLLPARRSIEFDSPDRPPPVPPRRRAAWAPALGTLAALALFWFGVSRLLGPAPFAPSAAALASRPVPAALPQRDSGDVLLARTELGAYLVRFEALDGQFATAFLALQLGNLSQKQFSDGLEQWLLPQWEALAVQLRDGRTTAGAVRSRARELLGSTVDSARRALYLYARGLREQDFRGVENAFRHLHDAEAHEAQARDLLRELEQAPLPAPARG